LIRLGDPSDEGAWHEFVDIYRPLVHRLACRLGLQDADAEDLAQEVFVVVASAIDRGLYESGRGTFRGWLFRVARNLTVNALIARGRHPRGTGDTEMVRLLGEVTAPSAGDSAIFNAEYRRRLLEWAADRVRGEFSDAAWDAFWATGVDGQPAPDVAERLGLSVGSVYNAKSRVMARLRREIARVEGKSENEPSFEQEKRG
jgi:RNA polymerase sigma-70 factor (ECF subfamily)